MSKLAKVGYGQIEPNQVTFTRDGRIEGQLPFYNVDPDVKCENGMLLAVDYVEGQITFPVASDARVIGINYTSEELYDARTPGLKNFYIGAEGYNVNPRIGFLTVGERFTTNTVELGTYTAATLKTAIATGTAVYGGIGVDGYITISDTKPTFGPVLQAIKVTDLPDGQAAVKFVVA